MINTQNPNIRCHQCQRPFDVQNPTWCSCAGATRSLVCPSCLHCFCAAPLPYKRRFWNAAPRALREHPNRFKSAALTTTKPSSHSRLVLVVDDEELNRSMVASVLEAWGYRVLTAADGEEGWATFEANPVDVVITDALMPKIDGRELSLRIKNSARGATTKVILMTSLYTKFQHRTEAYKTFRVDEYLLKPLKFPELAAALQRLMTIAEVA